MRAVIVLGDSGGLALHRNLRSSALQRRSTSAHAIAAASGSSTMPLALLVREGAGLLLAFIIEAAIAMIALHESVVNALFFSTRSVATVADVPGWRERLRGSRFSLPLTRSRRCRSSPCS